MTEKEKLIESIQNLVKHIASSHTNQEEIFNTFTNYEFHKILSNLHDSNKKVRILTLLLISQLLYNNIRLQKRFCQNLDIPTFPAKIVLSGQLSTLFAQHPTTCKEVIKLMKQQASIKQQKPLFWYIDLKTEPIDLKTMKMESINSFQIDPMDCIIGIWVQKEKSSQQKGTVLLQTIPTIQEQQHESPTIFIRERNKTMRNNRNKQHHIERKNYSKDRNYNKIRFNKKQKSHLMPNLNNKSHNTLKPEREDKEDQWSVDHNNEENSFKLLQDYAFTYIKPNKLTPCSKPTKTFQHNSQTRTLK